MGKLKKFQLFFVFVLGFVLLPNLVSAQETLGVNSETSLNSCISVGNTCKLTSNIELTNKVEIYTTATIDLNGFKITPNATMAIKGGFVRVGYDGNLTIMDSVGTGEITVGDRKTDSIYGAIQVGVGVYDESKTSTLTIDGGKIEGYYYGIVGNGNNHNTIITINGGTITGTNTSDCLGIYHPQNGSLTINDGIIAGSTGIEMRAGQLTINGGTITGTAIPVDVTPNGNGSTTLGAAVAIAQHTTMLDLSVEITGGTMKGYSAIYQTNPQDNDLESINKVSMEITGGTMNAINGGTLSVYSKNLTKFITGGTFNTDITTYLADNYVVESNDNTYTIKRLYDININGLNATVTTNVEKSKAGEEITITSAANNGYEITSLSVKDINNNIIEVTNNKFTMPNGEVTIYVETAKINNIVIVTPENGEVSTDVETAIVGTNVEITTTPDEGYELEEIVVLDDSKENVEVSENSFTMPSSNVSVEATFKPIVYNFTKGDNETFTKDEENGLVFKLDGPFELFDKLFINDKEVEKKYYTAVKGSTIITLKNEYVETLEEGTYDIKVTYTNNTEVSSTFKLENPIVNPNTGDNMIAYMLLITISLIGIYVSSKYLKKELIKEN